MRHSPARLPAMLAISISLVAATAGAQNSTPSAGQTPAPATGQQSPENEWLAKTASIYYSSAKAGLTGFTCDVHPDWRALFVSASKGADVSASDPNLLELNKVKVRMHARMKGASTIEWLVDSSEGPPANSNTESVIDSMHQTVQQMLEGFMQFWSPFMEVSVVPNKADGLEITHTPATHTIHAKQGNTELTEIFNGNLVLEHFDVALAGTTIKFAPTFESTPQGLLVKKFAADIRPAGATPQQTQKMQVRVNYQTLNNQMIPGQVNMEIVGTGAFNFAFDGCSTETN